MAIFGDPQTRGYARLAGIFYLVIAVAGAFSIAFVPSQIFVPGDVAASLGNIVERRGLFNIGLAGDVIMMLAEIMVTAMLYLMFRQVNQTLSLAAALARFAMVGVMAAMLFFHAGTLALSDPESALTVLAGDQRAALAALTIAMHDAGVGIWQIFFTLHLVLLGSLVVQSGVYPRLLGQAMILGAFGYLLDTVYVYIAPGADWLGYFRVALLVVVTLAEIGFALWLVLVGPRAQAAGRA